MFGDYRLGFDLMIRLESRSKSALVAPYARFERPRLGASRARFGRTGRVRAIVTYRLDLPELGSNFGSNLSEPELI